MVPENRSLRKLFVVFVFRRDSWPHDAQNDDAKVARPAEPHRGKAPVLGVQLQEGHCAPGANDHVGGGTAAGKVPAEDFQTEADKDERGSHSKAGSGLPADASHQGRLLVGGGAGGAGGAGSDARHVRQLGAISGTWARTASHLLGGRYCCSIRYYYLGMKLYLTD